MTKRIRADCDRSPGLNADFDGLHALMVLWLHAIAHVPIHGMRYGVYRLSGGRASLLTAGGMFSKKSPQLLLSSAVIVALFMSLLSSMVSPAPVKADTTVSGQISSDTTWNRTNSPYLVAGSILVSQGVTLTIEPGVTVKFEALKGLQIDGQLIARGTEAEPTVFTSNQASPAPGDWCGVVFSDKSVDTVVDQNGGYLSGSILEYCTIEYGGASDQPALQLSSGTGSRLIEHCVIKNNASTGLRSQSAALYATSCTVSGNSAGGIHTSDGQSTISGCIVSGNSASGGAGGGIVASGGPLTIVGCTISGNSAVSGGGICAVGSSSLTISDCTIYQNSSSHYGGGISAHADSLTIVDCTIYENSAYNGGGGVFASGGSLNMSGCTVYGNSAQGGGGIGLATSQSTVVDCAIYENSSSIDGGGVLVGYGSLAMTSSTISGNSASNGGGISVHVSSPVVIRYSAIQANTATGGKGGGVDLADGEIQGCNMAGNSPYEVFCSSGVGGKIEATGNWWGTTDEPTIQSHIWDWSDDASLGIVDYIPYLTSEVDITPPTIPVVTDEGTSTSNNTRLLATWTTSQDPDSGVSEYQYAIGTTAGGIEVLDWTSTGTATEVTKTGLSLTWGTAYYFAVKARNGSGMWGDVGVSDGILVSDATAPSTPVVTDDGASTSTTTQLHATWTASDAESGIAEYHYAVGTTAGGTDVLDWTSAGTATEATKTGLSLTWGTACYFAVKARNGAGAWSSIGLSDGITITESMTQPPNRPQSVSPADAATNTSLVPILQSSAFSDPDSGDTHAASQWQVTSVSGDYSSPVYDSDRDTINLTQVTVPALKLSYGTTYYWRVRHQDNHGAWSEGSSETSFTTTATVDTTPPTTPVVTDVGGSTSNSAQLHATWTSSDPETGIAEYQYAIGTSPGATDVVDWRSAGIDTEITHTGLSLTVGSTYYVSVKAQNGQGLWSEVGTSGGIVVTRKEPSLGNSTPYVIGGVCGGLVLIAASSAYIWRRRSASFQLSQYRQKVSQWEQEGYDVSDFKKKWLEKDKGAES